jgi:flagellar protein FliJ
MANKQVVTMLKDLASKEVDAAAEALAKANRALDDANSKYLLLKDYRLGYYEKLNAQLQQGMVADVYQNFQNFFKKLDQAIVGQLNNIELAKQHVKACKDMLVQSQRKKLSYAVLGQRQEKKDLQLAQKRDQKMMDEFAMRSKTRA